MSTRVFSSKMRRRTLLKGAVAAGALQFATPFVVHALGETPIKIGYVDPLTGAYAAPARNEITGAKYALEQVNAKGGILGRRVEMLVEDSANDVGTGVQKAHKLIDRDHVNFLAGDVNSAIALALAQVSSRAKILHIVPGGHAHSVTGKDCKWNVYRVCTDTDMEANAVTGVLVKKYGKRWYFITPDYSFGHELESGLSRDLLARGGTIVGNALTPLGTTDFSSYLIKAVAAKPDVIVPLVQGRDSVDCMKQIAMFGIQKKIPIAGSQIELEALEGMPPESRIGTWLIEWYWKQPGVPHVSQFVAEIRKRNGGRVPTARHWFGFVTIHTFALVANQEKTLDAVKLAHALAGFDLPPEIKLQPNKVFYRAGDHQLMLSQFVGELVKQGKDDPDDLFHVDTVIPGAKDAPPLSTTGCHVAWPG